MHTGESFRKLASLGERLGDARGEMAACYGHEGTSGDGRFLFLALTIAGLQPAHCLPATCTPPQLSHGPDIVPVQGYLHRTASYQRKLPLFSCSAPSHDQIEPPRQADLLCALYADLRQRPLSTVRRSRSDIRQPRPRPPASPAEPSPSQQGQAAPRAEQDKQTRRRSQKGRWRHLPPCRPEKWHLGTDSGGCKVSPSFSETGSEAYG